MATAFYAGAGETAGGQFDGAKKRQRVSVACSGCRAKRMRCDGLKPNCGSCVQRGIACEYQQGDSKRKPPSKRYVESLQARIRLLEEQLTSVGKTLPTSEDPNDALSENDSTDSDASYARKSDDKPQRDPLEEVTNMVGRLNVGEDGQFRFFGSQSNFNLLHGHMGEIVRPVSARAQDRGLSAVSKLGKEVTVSDELQEHLLDLYWRWQNPWSYVVHKAAFLEDFRNTKEGKYCTPLLLSAIFALASRYSDRIELRTDPDDPNTAGDAFSEKAHVLLLYESEAATTATTQAAALMSLRAMSENKEARGWLYSGMATRMAYNLGLNLDCSRWVKAGLISTKDFEVRKVTWWGCYALDKLFAMGLGRPGTTKSCDITCPKPTLSHDAELGPWVPCADSDMNLLGAHSRIASTAWYSCENLRIASEALDQIYAPNSRLSKSDIEHVIAKADVNLHAFYSALPSYLRLPVSSRIAALPHIYQLHIQYHVTQNLLHRPLISKRCSSSTLVSASSTDTNHHMQTCRHSATEIAKLLQAYQYHYTLRLIPIVTVHNTFTAAITHLIDVASTDLLIRKQGIRHLQTCIKALQEMSTAWSWSSRALHALKLLAQEWMLPERIGEQRRPSQPRNKMKSQTTISNTGAKLPDQQLPKSVPESANSLGGERSNDVSAGQADYSDDINLLFDFGAPLDMNEGEGIGSQSQMDAWLLDAAQDIFTIPGWEYDDWSSNIGLNF